MDYIIFEYRAALPKGLLFSSQRRSRKRALPVGKIKKNIFYFMESGGAPVAGWDSFIASLLCDDESGSV
jgi:hypothetical protein